VGRILDREGELAFEASVAHAVTTCKLDSLAERKVIVHAHETVDPLLLIPILAGR
jgi:hypothetical protein